MFLNSSIAVLKHTVIYAVHIYIAKYQGDLEKMA